MRGRTPTLLLPLSFLLLVRVAGQEAPPAPAEAAPGNPTSGAGELVIQTTHVVSLENGKTIKASVVQQTPRVVRLGLKPYGTFDIPRAQIAAVREEQGRLVVPPREPKRPAAPPVHRPAQEETRPKRQLTPPPVPADMQEKVNYWLYHLTRQRQHWRVRAETHLKAMGSPVTGPVIPFARRPEWLVRCAALRILAHVGHPAGVSTLWRAMDDEHPVVRQVAYEGLKKVTGRSFFFDPRETRGRRKRQAQRWERHLREQGLLPE